jgi:hypothetical protein
MPDEHTELDALIESYEAKIASMQDAVAALKKARDALGGLSLGSQRATDTEIGPDAFTGMTIAEAAEKYLRIVGRPARTTENIVEGLMRGGLRKVSPASVASILVREHNSDGPVVRVQKGVFGLAAWYPRRPPKTKGAKANGEEAEADEESGEAEGEAEAR